MSSLKILFYIIILELFLGCGTVQTSQIEDNSTNIVASEINSSQNIEDGTLFTFVSTPLLQEPTNYIDKFINDDNCNQILDKDFFVICYDYNLKSAKSVAYTLEGDLVNELNIQERPEFYEEELIDEAYRAKSSDYSGSGYDRGHMAPDASFDWSQESLEATYSLANIIPQVPEVNRYMWANVEAYARDKAVELGKIDVVNVIRYDNNNLNRIGEDNIAISIGYYKILFNRDELYEECFYYANNLSINIEDDNLSRHKVNCRNIVTR